MENEKRYIEAALFISSRPLSLDELRQITGIGAVGYVQKLADELKKEYEEKGSAVEITEAEGRYEMRIRGQYVNRVKQFAQDAEISRSALRTLAFISKHDGILKSDVVKRIGSQVYENVKELTEAGFVKQHKAGRSSKLVLTDKFRRYFETKQEEIKKAEEETQTKL